MTPDKPAERLLYLMFRSLKAVITQKTAIFTASIIGLACCVAAVVDMRSQQAGEHPTLRPMAIGQAAGQDAHHMRGWHKGRGLG